MVGTDRLSAPTRKYFCPEDCRWPDIVVDAIAREEFGARCSVRMLYGFATTTEQRGPISQNLSRRMSLIYAVQSSQGSRASETGISVDL